MAKLGRGRKAVIVTALCLAAAAIVVRHMVFERIGRDYRLRLATELLALKAEAGTTHIGALAARLPDSAPNAATALAAGRPYYPAPADLFAAKAPEPVAVLPGHGSPVALGGASIAVSDIAKAWEEFESWRGLMPLAEAPSDAADRPGPVEWRQGWLAPLEAYLQANAVALAAAREAAEIGQADFKVKWDPDVARGVDRHCVIRTSAVTEAFSHHGDLRDAARLLRLDCAVRAARGDMKGACEDVRLGFRLRRLVEGEPALLSFETALYCDAAAASALSGALEWGAPDREDVDAVLAGIDGREKANDLTRTLQGEAALVVARFDEVLFDIDHPERRPRRVADFFFLSGEEYYTLINLRRERERMAKGFPSALEPRQLIRAGIFGIRLDRLADEAAPVWDEAFVRAAAANARLGMVRAALALALYRSRQGAYPETLDALAPSLLAAVPADPFSGGPLLYRRDGDGYVVYSVSRDKTDNGGARPADIAWRKAR